MIIFSSAWCWNYFCTLMVSALLPNEGWRYQIESNNEGKRGGWWEGRRPLSLCFCFFLTISCIHFVWVLLLLKHFCALLVHFLFCFGLFWLSNSCFLSWFVITFFVSFSLAFFFLSSIPSPPAYLDDEEDEDPFGDYVISKSRLTAASLRLLGPP